MNKGKRQKERLKNLAIVFLLASTLFLGWKTSLFGELFSSVKVLSDVSGWVGNLFNGMPSPSTEASISASAYQNRPKYFAVTNHAGAHYGVKYDNLPAPLYDISNSLLAQALGSAASATTVNEDIWKTALMSEGMFFDYVDPVPVSVLAGWMSADIKGAWANISVRKLCVTVSGDTGNLFFQDAANGQFYSSGSFKLKNSSIASSLSGYVPNKAVFAFELGDKLKAAKPYQLLLTEGAVHTVILAQNPVSTQAAVNEVLKNLRVSTNFEPTYTDPDGTLVFVKNNFTLRIRPDGTATYQKATTSGVSGSSLPLGKTIDTAREMAEETVGVFSGGASVNFYSFENAGDGSTVITFYYYISGSRIHIGEDGWAARVSVKNGVVNWMELHFRKYFETEKEISLLPEIQAAAASGGEIILCYSDMGGSELKPEWIAD